MQVACRHGLAAGHAAKDCLIDVSELQQGDELRVRALARVDPWAWVLSQVAHSSKTLRIVSRLVRCRIVRNFRN